MGTNFIDEDDDYIYGDVTWHHDCPKCGRTYDDADYDFQICHFCWWDADEEKYVR